MRGGFLVLAVVAATVMFCEAATINDFPYVQCSKRQSAYTVAPTVRMLNPNTFCFTIQVAPPSGCTSYCCQAADLRKILVDVNPTCITQNPNISTTVNGVPTKVGPAFEAGVNGPSGTYALRLTQLGLNLTTAAGAEVCVTLGPNTLGLGCTTMEQLCKTPQGGEPGDCAIALFDSQYDCCPISEVSPPPVVAPTLEPCPTCLTLELNVVGAYVFYEINLTEKQCQTWSDMVVTDIVAIAEASNAMLQAGPPQITCTNKMLQACVTFASPEDGLKVQSAMNDMLPFWYDQMINGCKQYWSYPYMPMIRIDNGVDGTGCLNSQLAISCDPAPIPFPLCNCDTMVGSTPFFASPYLTACNTTECNDMRPANDARFVNTQLYCFNLFVREPVQPWSACGSTTNLLKAEVYADDTKRRAIKAISVRTGGPDPSLRALATSWAPLGENTLKLTPLNLSVEQADGAKICLSLERWADINEFCPNGATCAIVFFDNSKGCCPLFKASV